MDDTLHAIARKVLNDYYLRIGVKPDVESYDFFLGQRYEIVQSETI